MAALLQQSATVLAFPRGPHATLLTDTLRYHRLPEKLLQALVREAAVQPGDLKTALAAALCARLRPSRLDLEKARGILLMGPSGAGKSAVAAKLIHAARLAGRQAEWACASDGLALFRTGTHPAHCLTVMEADGFNPVNARARSAFASLNDIEGVESIGVLSAASDAEDVAEIVSALRFRRVIVTGLDRTRRLGALAAAILQGTGLACVTSGPRSDDALENPCAETLAQMLLDPAN